MASRKWESRKIRIGGALQSVTHIHRAQIRAGIVSSSAGLDAFAQLILRLSSGYSPGSSTCYKGGFFLDGNGKIEPACAKVGRRARKARKARKATAEGGTGGVM